MKVAVTGASGHVGGNLVRALQEKGHSVRALVRGDTRAIEGLDAEKVKGDILEPQTLKAAFRGVDTVYHLAARISIAPGDEAEVAETNIAGTRNVVDACLKGGVRRLVHFSSIHAFDQKPLDKVLDELRECVDLEKALPYDRTKVGAEKVVMDGIARGLDAVILNPTGVIGPYDFKPSPMGEAILGLMRRTIPALVNSGFNWVDVRDVCDAAINSAGRGVSGEKYVLSGNYATIPALGKIIESVTGVRMPGLVAPLWLASVGAPFASAWARYTGRRPLYTSESLEILKTCNRKISCEKAVRELAYEPRPLIETIADTCQWFTAAGYA